MPDAAPVAQPGKTGQRRHIGKVLAICVPGAIAAIIHIKLFDIMHMASRQYPSDVNGSGTSLASIFGDMGRLMLLSLGLQLFTMAGLAALLMWVLYQKKHPSAAGG